MANLTHDMRRVVLEQKLGFAATVCPDGTPNLSPKGTTTVWDDEHLLFADIWSPQTVRNLDGNPCIEINVVDPIVRKGYRFNGRARLHSDGDIFERGLALLRDRGYDARRERVKTIVLVRASTPHHSPHRHTKEVRARSKSRPNGSSTPPNSRAADARDQAGIATRANIAVSGQPLGGKPILGSTLRFERPPRELLRLRDGSVRVDTRTEDGRA
jgi:hypothetical protein